MNDEHFPFDEPMDEELVAMKVKELTQERGYALVTQFLNQAVMLGQELICPVIVNVRVRDYRQSKRLHTQRIQTPNQQSKDLIN